jgi:hypothetical protein
VSPYYVTNDPMVTDCPRWAVVKEDGELVACHGTKADAISQMVAVSLAEKIPVGGEWETRS